VIVREGSVVLFDYYYVISGEVEFVESGQAHVLAAGDFCLVGRGERFSYRRACSALPAAHAQLRR